MSVPAGQIPGLCLTPDPQPKPGRTQAFSDDFLKDRAENLKPKAAVSVGNLWDPGSTIRVGFLDSDPWYHEQVKTHLTGWTDAVNLHFEFVPANDPSADVRVTFAYNRVYDSLLGRDAHDRVKGQGDYTMRLGIDPQHAPDMINFYVLHEFGHVLGLVHEHQSPGAAAIDWNERAVIDYYLRTNPSWTEDVVRNNILTRLIYKAQVQNFTAFDADSVMLYPIPEGLANNVTRPGFNTQLSASDRRFCEMLYPFGETDLEVGADAEGEIKTNGQHDSYRFPIADGGDYAVTVKSDFPISVSLFGPETRSVFLAENHNEQQGGARINQQLTPGTYFLKVQQFVLDRPGKYTASVRRA